MIGVVLLVLFVHFGGTNVPKVLKDNKQILYGVVIGLVLCSFFGLNIEGFWARSSGIKGHYSPSCYELNQKAGEIEEKRGLCPGKNCYETEDLCKQSLPSHGDPSRAGAHV